MPQTEEEIIQIRNAFARAHLSNKSSTREDFSEPEPENKWFEEVEEVEEDPERKFIEENIKNDLAKIKKNEVFVTVEDITDRSTYLQKNNKKTQPRKTPDISPSSPRSSNGGSSQTIDFNNPEAIASAEEQHKVVDSYRSTDGIDYMQLRDEADALVVLRVNLQRENRLCDYDRIGGGMYPEFKRKFPNFFSSIKTVDMDRLEETVNIMHLILDKLDKVKSGEMTHTEMREQVFEKDLAERFVKAKK